MITFTVFPAVHGQSWDPFGPADGNLPSEQSGWNCVAKFDPSGNIILAYKEAPNLYQAAVRKWNGTNWSDIGNSGFSGGMIDFPSLALDSSGNPYLAFKDYTNGEKSTVMHWDGIIWNYIGNAGFSSGKAQFSLA